MVDKDELNEAMYKNEISKKQYNLACNVADRLMNDISNSRVILMNRYETDLKYMFKLIK